MEKKILQKLEFDKVVEQLAQLASSELGVKKARAIHPFTTVKKIEKSLEETEDAVQLLRLKGGMPCAKINQLTMSIKRLEIGAALNGKELADIGKVLTSTRDMARFFHQAKTEEIMLMHLYRYADHLVWLPELTKAITSAVASDGSLFDDASVTLRHIRQAIKKAEGAVRDTLDKVVRAHQQKLTDTIITVRNDRFVIPVKQEHKNAFGGMIHDQSTSGQTFFVEPQEVMVLNNRLKTLQSEEKQEIERILQELSALAAEHIKEIENNHNLLGELDFINAKALYAKQLKATYPKVNKERIVKLYGARHPLIDQKVVVKNDVMIGEDYQSIVITGPNTGGKTILLKTLGVIQLMGQSGLHIPCDENSQIGVFTQIFADIGDEQSIEQNLSTFSSHMSNVVSILTKIDAESLLLFDELGSGTDPQEGSALAMSILDYIALIGSYVVATTHYPELKMYGYNHIGTINASMEFDSQTLAPTYKFLLGIPGRSNAFDISKRLGLPNSIIEQARQFVHEDSQELNDMITSLEQMRQQVARDKETLEAQIEKSSTLLDDLLNGKAYLDETRDELLLQAKQKANELVETAQKEAEKLISDIRQMQLRQGQAVIKEHEFIEKKTALENLKHEELLKKNKVLQKAKRNKALKVGDSVEVMSYGQKGVLVEKSSDAQWVVQMGVLKMKINQNDLRLLDTDNQKQQRYIPTLKGPRKKVGTQLDLRGQRYDNAVTELDRYLDAAILSNFKQVTIVHGRGTGAVREGVIQHLKKHKGVKSFAFAPVNQGGDGATIVQLG